MEIRKSYLFIIIILFFTYTGIAQVKIGDDVSTIHDASLFELESTSKALVLTRVTNTQMLAIVPLNGALIYNTDTNCVHVFDGSNWQSLCGNTAATDGNEVQQEQLVIVANNGQTQFTTPAPIIDSKKIEVFRNGIRVDFTTIDANTIELESDIICYQNDSIRIVQLF